MGNTPSFNDAFARRTASEAEGLGLKPDRLKPQPKSPKVKQPARIGGSANAFAAKSPRPAPAKGLVSKDTGTTAATPTRTIADAFRPAPKPPKAPKLSPLTAARPVTKAELLARAGQAKPTARPTIAKPKATAARAAALIPVAQKTRPALAKPLAKAVAKPGFAHSSAKPAPGADPVLHAPIAAASTTALLPHEAARSPLHVVASQPAPVHRKLQILKGRPAARSSSLVLVSGAGAMTASNADVLEKPAPEVEKPADPPPPPEPVAAAPPPETRRGGGSGGGAGGGSGAGGDTPGAAVVQTRRGFNQDDAFGVIFGILVILFLLLWFMRGRGEVTPQEPDALVSPQSVAALPPPPSAALVDPFAGAPIDLRPKGDIPETLPDDSVVAATPSEQPAIMQAIPPPAAAVPPPVVTPQPPASLAETRLNAWFCTASSTITTASRNALNTELEKFAGVFEGKELIVRGYADTRGATAFNSALGGERARVVADFLRTKGLTVAEFSGVGELDGLDDNQNCSNQRRVDVWVKGGPAEEPSRACAPTPEVEALVCGR
jgi:outer membrane protein OmpA-like peptidoglycan-associated protein